MRRPRQPRFVAAVGNAQAREGGPEQSEDGEEEEKNGLQAGEPPLELGDANPKLGRRGMQSGRRKDRLRGTLDPAGHGRAWDADARRDGRVTRLLDEPDEAMVVDPLAAPGAHARIVPPSDPRGKRQGSAAVE